jgi:cholesterol oxidase
MAGTGNADAVIIGSGFAGSVAADRLIEAGLSVVMLERGPWRDTVPVRSMGIADRTPFPRGGALVTDTLRSVHHRWLPKRGLTLNRRGLIEIFFGEGLSSMCSSSVGGGSHVYSGLFRYPQVEGFWDGICDGMSNEEMAPHYERVLARFKMITPTAALKIPHQAHERFGPDDPMQGPASTPPTWLGFLYPEEIGKHKRVTDENGIERTELDYDDPDSHGFLGSPSGAKTTLDFLYLAPLLKRGLVLHDLAEAMTIVAQPRGMPARYRVDYRDHRSGEVRALHTDHVILGAGAINTLKLLLHSREVTKTLAGMPWLGKRIGGNGDLFAFWDYNEPGRNLSTGLPFHGGFQLKDPNYPIPLGGGGWPAAETYPLPRFLKERIKRAAFTNCMGVDAMDGSLSMEDGRLRLRFDARNSPIYDQVKATFRRVSEVTGRRIYYPKSPITVHALGGACMDRDAEHGVVDAQGEVFDNPGLYVADGAAFPRIPGGPPTFTIAAWASHLGDKLVEKLRHAV